VYTLTELVPLADSPRGFIMPIFASSKSNFSYVQNLDVFGSVKNFMRIDEKGNTRLPHSPPPISLDIGDRGILAFVDDDDILHIGNIEQMKKILLSARVESPFIMMEVSSILNNRDMHKSALMECASYLKSESTRKSWMTREKLNFVSSQIKIPSSKSIEDTDEKLQVIYEEILYDLDHEKWNSIWLRLWKQGFDKRKLSDLASLRIDSNRLPGRDGPTIFTEIVDQKFGRQYLDKAINCLELSRLDSEYWIRLYGTVSRLGASRERMRDVAMRILQLSIDAKSPEPWGWLHLARRINAETRFSESERQRMMEISIQYLERKSYISNEVAETTILPYLDYAHKYRTIFESGYRWATSSQRSTNAWCEIFLKLLEIEPTPELIHVGLEWVQNLGGNVIRWRQVWKRLEKYTDRETHRFIAIAWLRRARWDMGVWIIVFHEVMEDSNAVEKIELLEIANRWIDAGFGNRRSRAKMRQAKDYLEAITLRT